MTASRGEATRAARREQLGGAQDLTQGLAMGVFASSALARRWTCEVQSCTSTEKRVERLYQQEQAPPDKQTGQSIRACLRREVPTDHEAHSQSFNGSAPWKLKRKKKKPYHGKRRSGDSYGNECRTHSRVDTTLTELRRDRDPEAEAGRTRRPRSPHTQALREHAQHVRDRAEENT